MRIALIAFTLATGLLSIYAYFQSVKVDEQAAEITSLQNKVESLHWKIYMDSTSTAAYNFAQKVLGLQK